MKAHFTNILNGGIPENTEARVNVPSSIFLKILDFAYTGHCKIEGGTVEILLRTADQYHVLGVIQLCCQYILGIYFLIFELFLFSSSYSLDQLQPTNCLGILRFARHYFCSDLEKKGKRYIRHNFIKLFNEGNEFENLSINEVVEILKDDELNVRNEEFVYEAVKKWVDKDTNERKVHILTLLKCIRLGTLSFEFISTNIMKWNVVTESQVCFC